MGEKKLVKISDLVPKPSKVTVSDTSFLEVRALTIKEIIELFWLYQDAFLSVYAEGQQAQPNYTHLLVAAPNMVADIIAKAANAEGQQEDILLIPGTVQLIALAEIWKISVPDPKKLKESLSVVMAGLKRLSTEEPQVKEQPVSGEQEKPLSKT